MNLLDLPTLVQISLQPLPKWNSSGEEFVNTPLYKIMPNCFPKLIISATTLGTVRLYTVCLPTVEVHHCYLCLFRFFFDHWSDVFSFYLATIVEVAKPQAVSLLS